MKMTGRDTQASAVLKALVMQMLRDAAERPEEWPEDCAWTLQGFGMLRAKLSPTVRLHVWDSRYKLPRVTEPHDHPWSFESAVIAGRVRQFRHKVYERGDARPPWRGHHPYVRSTIRCGEGACVVGEGELVWMSSEYEEYYEGTSYGQEANVIHTSFPDDGTVTLVRRVVAEGASPDHANVYWPEGGTFVSAAPRLALPEEVRAIAGRALRLHFADHEA